MVPDHPRPALPGDGPCFVIPEQAEIGSGRYLAFVPEGSPECEEYRARGYAEYPTQAEAQAAEDLALDADTGQRLQGT